MRFPFVSRSMHDELVRQYEARLAEKDLIIANLDTERRQVWNRLHKQIFGMPMWKDEPTAPVDHETASPQPSDAQQREDANSLQSLLLKANGRASKIGRMITAKNIRKVARSAGEVGREQVRGLMAEAEALGKAAVQPATQPHPETGT